MHYLLDVQDIHTFIGQYHILQGVNARVPKGSITALLGRNGAGKTTTLKSILGLTPPRQGKVILGGRAIQGMHSFDIAALGIGFVPEHRPRSEASHQFVWDEPFWGSAADAGDCASIGSRQSSFAHR
jgi:ABC-type branched-subunit amino acid transport system ATPase component